MKNVILIVLDGWGIAPPGPGNAVTLANTRYINSLYDKYPYTRLQASGEAVGLPEYEAGNTEVGHINLGAGRIVYQDLPRINMSIADGNFYKNTALLKSFSHLRRTGGKLHVMGLVGVGTVHSSIDHLYALLYFAKENNMGEVYIHVITDGRDSPPKSSVEIVARLDEKLLQLGIGKVATIMGRYYAMDRDRRWERTREAYNCLVQGTGIKCGSVTDALNHAYDEGRTDEFILPKNICQQGRPVALIAEGDAVIFFNYRIDRPRQLTKAFVLDNFEEEANRTLSFDPYAVKYYKTHQPKSEILTPPFQRGNKIKDLLFITMTEYEEGLPVDVAFPPSIVYSPIGKVLADHHLKQLRMSESEKERFVTYYFNGQNEDVFPNEERLIIPSPKVATYDVKPDMSSAQLTDVAIQKILENKYEFILLNYANPDMVGHTGNIDASIRAVESVDRCLGKLIPTALNTNYSILVTADHGNVEQKINFKTGKTSTEHTSNMVPFIAISKDLEGRNVNIPTGILADVAPTILALMGLQKPHEMTGRNLLEQFRAA